MKRKTKTQANEEGKKLLLLPAKVQLSTESREIGTVYKCMLTPKHSLAHAHRIQIGRYSLVVIPNQF